MLVPNMAWTKGIRAQLLSMCAAPFLVVGIIGFASYFGFRSLKQGIDVVSSKLPSSIALGAMDTALTKIQLHLYEAYTTPLIDQAGRSKTVLDVKKEIENFDRANQTFKSLTKDERELEIYKGFAEHLENQRKFISQVVTALEKNTKSENDQAEAIIQGPLTDGLVPLIESMSSFHTEEQTATNEAQTEVSRLYTLISRFTFAASGFGLLALTLLGVAVARRMVRALTLLSYGLGETEESVVNSSVELARASSALFDSTVRNASSVQQTLSAITEVSAMIGNNSTDAARAHAVADANLQITTEGQKAVENMISAINEIKTTNHAISERVDRSNLELGEILRVIGNIHDKTKVINEIVFQTKLLSFNASVEAARAGEHGRGFSVVADEIGSLARLSGAAATDIAALLNASSAQVEEVIESSKASINQILALSEEKISSGAATAQQCGQVFAKILEKATVGVEANGQIARASNEQASGVQLVDSALHDISRTTESNRDMSEQTALISKTLSQESLNLRRMVRNLKTIVDGKTVDDDDSVAA